MENRKQNHVVIRGKREQVSAGPHRFPPHASMYAKAQTSQKMLYRPADRHPAGRIDKEQVA
jgi:hypothetical protein